MKKALFSIDERKKVVFSRGNLQYRDLNYKWRFAEHQYDYIGKGCENAAHDEWIDLLQWQRANSFWDEIEGGEGCTHWRLLNQCEWGYLFFERETQSGISYVGAKVHGVNGLILVPDDWDGSDYEFVNANNYRASYNDNVISDAQWELLEQEGLAFLPAAGYECAGVAQVGEQGTYWTSSPMGGEGGMHFVFFEENFFIDELEREFGCSVRLVRRSR